jgi:predicted RNA-binding Zn-ribbon protein involved in translation (DUF1610 family)
MPQSSYILQCPDCPGVLHFSSDQSTIIICPSCGSVIKRNKEGALQSKPQFIVSIKSEIIQPGTTGVWESRPFTVLGRFRAWFEESVFNYWTIQFSNGEIAWLGEGYGIYSILKPAMLTEKISGWDINAINIGDLKSFNAAEKFILEKKQKTIKWEIEGELYIPESASSAFTLLEFSAVTGKNISLFEFGRDSTIAYEVTYISFSSLQFKNLREYNNKGKNFTCTACSKHVHIKTYPYAQSCACPSCGTFYSLKDGMDFKKEKSTKTDGLICLPLGSVGQAEGIQYEVIGYAQKEEQNIYHSKWKEYTLFNPQEGFAFLSEYEGHWIYIREKGDSPVLLNQNDRNFDFDNEPFQLFNAYNYEVIAARGEFPYNIFDNRNTKVREYISPPEIWIQERDKNEGISWFFGKHIEPSEIEHSFKPDTMPYRSGIGAVQPTGYISLPKMIRATFIGILLLLFTHFFIGLTKNEKVLLSETYSFNDSSDQFSFVTSKFTLDKWRSNLQFTIVAAVSNSWFELGATLVNTVTGKEYSLEKGVEYYYGYSDGESWTEGSTREDAYLTRIPAGTYFLQLQGTRENNLNKIPDFFVEVAYDVQNVRNVWLAIVLLLLWPVGKYLLIHYNEKRRWSNSPYSPYESLNA